MKKPFFFAALMVFLFVAAAYAGEKFGVQIYPGAKLDTAASKILKEQIGANGFCYRTNDSVQNVAEFYKKKGLSPMGDMRPEGAGFKTKTGVHVTIQNPWMDMETGKMIKDTLISIVKVTD
jgi:hypothetical protein